MADLIPRDALVDPVALDRRLKRAHRAYFLWGVPLWRWFLDPDYGHGTLVPVYAEMRDGSYAAVTDFGGTFYEVEGYETWGQVQIWAAENAAKAKFRTIVYSSGFALIVLFFTVGYLPWVADPPGWLAIILLAMPFVGLYLIWKAWRVWPTRNVPKSVPLRSSAQSAPIASRQDPFGSSKGHKSI